MQKIIRWVFCAIVLNGAVSALAASPEVVKMSIEFELYKCVGNPCEMRNVASKVVEKLEIALSQCKTEDKLTGCSGSWESVLEFEGRSFKASVTAFKYNLGPNEAMYDAWFSIVSPSVEPTQSRDVSIKMNRGGTMTDTVRLFGDQTVTQDKKTKEQVVYTSTLKVGPPGALQ